MRKLLRIIHQFLLHGGHFAISVLYLHTTFDMYKCFNFYWEHFKNITRMNNLENQKV